MKKILISLLAIVAISAAFATTGTGATGGVDVINAKIADGVKIGVDMPVSYLDNIESPNAYVTVPIAGTVELSGSYANLQSIMVDPDLDLQWNEWIYTAGIKAGFGLGADKQVKVAVGGTYLNEAEKNSIIGNWANAYLAVTANVAGVDLTGNATYYFSTNDLMVDEDFSFGFAAEKALADDFVLGAEYVVGNGVNYKNLGKSYGNLYGELTVGEKVDLKLALTGIGYATSVNFGIGYTF